ncbi:hypothetical protein B566_EDAN010545 [Ephemera danica]|nr:hypothetical protein B566_EDAN010545 [Ephemera danica]
MGSVWSLPPLFISPHRTEVVKYVNESYIASCQSERGIHVMWTRPTGEQITQTKGRIHVEERWQVKGVNVIFESLEKKDRGNYTCSATVDGKEHKQAFKLVVIKPISFLDTPRVQNASEHQDMLIRCEVDGDPEPKVAWQVKGKQPQAPKYKVMADGLYIRNVSLADRGDYLCRAFQASPIANKPLWPQEQSERERAYGFVSGHVNLSCAAVAEPEPNFEWLKENRSIELHEPHAQLFREPSRSVLQLAVHNESVFGEYVCRASNALGTLERVVVLREAARPATPKMSVQAKTADTITLGLNMPPESALATSGSGPAPLEVSGFRVQVKPKDDTNWQHAFVFDFMAGKFYNFFADYILHLKFYFFFFF